MSRVTGSSRPQPKEPVGAGITNHVDGASSTKEIQKRPVLREKDPSCSAEIDEYVSSLLDKMDMRKAVISEFKVWKFCHQEKDL